MVQGWQTSTPYCTADRTLKERSTVFSRSLVDGHSLYHTVGRIRFSNCSLIGAPSTGSEFLSSKMHSATGFPLIELSSRLHIRLLHELIVCTVLTLQESQQHLVSFVPPAKLANSPTSTALPQDGASSWGSNEGTTLHVFVSVRAIGNWFAAGCPWHIRPARMTPPYHGLLHLHR